MDGLYSCCMSMLCPRARHLIRIASVDLAVKCVSDGKTLFNCVCSVLWFFRENST